MVLLLPQRVPSKAVILGDRSVNLLSSLGQKNNNFLGQVLNSILWPGAQMVWLSISLSSSCILLWVLMDNPLTTNEHLQINTRPLCLCEDTHPCLAKIWSCSKTWLHTNGTFSLRAYSVMSLSSDKKKMPLPPAAEGPAKNNRAEG